MSHPKVTADRPTSLTPTEALLLDGRSARSEAPRSALATLTRCRRSAVEIVLEQNEGRARDLVPLRMARMLMDPFAFYRGSAAVMAADLAASPSSGIEVVSCGDAHLANFGLYAAPDRELVFDLNDFDESAAAPWEWDLKRLATSVVIGGRHAGYPAKRVARAARQTVVEYLEALREFLELDALARLYLRGHPERAVETMSDDLAVTMRRAMRSASRRTSDRVFAKLTVRGDDGELRLREDPPLLVHQSGLPWEESNAALQAYLHDAAPEIRLLMRQFVLVDIVRRVVGVGSVGTYCYLAIFTGPAGEPLVLQVKEAGVSVLERYGEVAQPPELAEATTRLGQGSRVVATQRILQAASDPFLGQLRSRGRDFYVRQFQDMKGSVDLDGMSERAFAEYARVCARTLARAHAQSRNAFRIVGYVGGGDAVTEAISAFAHVYADAAGSDFEALRDAAARGEFEVAPDPLR